MIPRQMLCTYCLRIRNCDNWDSICRWTIGYCRLGAHTSVNIHRNMVLDNSNVEGMPIDFEPEQILRIDKFQFMIFESGLGSTK